MAEVTLRGINKKFGTATAAKNIDLSIADGEFVVLLGPTGAGKTTTLRLIAGLEKPDSGQITIGGRDVLGPRLGWNTWLTDGLMSDADDAYFASDETSEIPAEAGAAA